MKKYHISDLDGIQQNETYMMQNGGFLGEQRMSIGDRTRWFALIVLCLGTLMIVLDTTIVNVALPSIRASLGFSGTSLAWVVNAYLLTFGGFLLLGGRLGDLFGHRRLFLLGITLFSLASLTCGLANSQQLLIGARAVQGLGGAVVSAVALSLIMNLFTEPAERAKAMGVFGFVAAGGGSIGVLLGGVLTSALNWHWIFLVNLPIGVAVFALCLVLLPAGRGPASATHLDVAGAVTVTASLMLAVFAIVNGNETGWMSAQTIGLLAAAAALLALFLGIGARVQPAAGRSRLPAGQPDHGCFLAWPLRQARHAVRHQVAARDGAAPGRGWSRSPRAGTGRRELRRRRAPQHDPARPRRRHRVQPDAACRHERRRAD